MDWYILAIIAPAFFALNGVIAKILMTKKFRGYSSFLAMLNIMDLIIVSSIPFFTPVSFEMPYILLPLVYGIIGASSFWFYSKAMMLEEISKISSIMQMIPIFVVVISAVFLGEILNMQQYAGIAVIIAAAILLSYKKGAKGKFLAPGFKYIVVFDIIIAVNTTIAKFALSFMDFWSFMFWNILGATVLVLALMTVKENRKNFVKTITTSGRKTFIGTFGQEAAYFAAELLTLGALTTGFVSLVSALGSLQPLYSLGFSIIASVIFPHFIDEKRTRQTVAIKLAGIIMILAGTMLLLYL
jgi:bacterial/archaeal transporter family protein